MITGALHDRRFRLWHFDAFCGYGHQTAEHSQEFGRKSDLPAFVGDRSE